MQILGFNNSRELVQKKHDNMPTKYLYFEFNNFFFLKLGDQ